MLPGIDCGSTAVEAVLFDAEGRTLAPGARRIEFRQPAPRLVDA